MGWLWGIKAAQDLSVAFRVDKGSAKAMLALAEARKMKMLAVLARKIGMLFSQTFFW